MKMYLEKRFLSYCAASYFITLFNYYFTKKKCKHYYFYFIFKFPFDFFLTHSPYCTYLCVGILLGDSIPAGRPSNYGDARHNTFSGKM